MGPAALSSPAVEAVSVSNIGPQDDASALSEEHRQYLLQRHGTLDLQPLPDMNDADPYNWPQRKVCTHNTPWQNDRKTRRSALRSAPAPG